MINTIQKIKNDVVAILLTNDSICWKKENNSNEFVSNIANYNVRLSYSREGEYILVVTKNNECCGKIISDKENPDIKVLYKNIENTLRNQQEEEYWKSFYEILNKS